MKRNLTFAFFGSSLVSAYWNGAATYYRGIIRALHRHGHSVTFYEPDAYDRQQHRDAGSFDYARVVVYPATEADALAACRSAAGADFIIKASGVGVFDALLEEAVLAHRGGNAKILFWDVDAPSTLDRMAANANDPFLPLIPEYDAIVTYGGGDPVVNAYLKLGAQRCVPIYNALDCDIHHPVEADPALAADLLFLGNRMPDRESRVQEFFFTPAKLLPECRFLLGGNGWERNVPDLPNVKYPGHVYTDEHNRYNCSARAVLNIDRESMARFGFSPPTRIFEAAGAGACIITDAWQGIELFLEPGRECIVAASGAEVARQLDALSMADAREMGRAARERIMAEHTYEHRALQLEKLLQEMIETPGRVSYEFTEI